MDPGNGRLLFACLDAALVRVAAHPEVVVPAWPDLTDDSAVGVGQCCAWLRQVWAVDAVADAVGHASPVLARQVLAVCAGLLPSPRQVHQLVLSVARYVLRMTGRATPFGLFAGVAPASFGAAPAVRWGVQHAAVGRADASWLAEVIGRLERCPPLRERLPLLTNTGCFVRGGRLVVPYQPRRSGEAGTAAVEVTMRFTPPVRLLVEAARSPVRGGELAGKLAAQYPAEASSVVDGLLADLIEQRVLISVLHAPSTTTDAFGYLMEQLEAVGADDLAPLADLLHRLRRIGAGLARHNSSASVADGRAARADVTAQMTAVTSVARQPLAVDLRMDCTLVLPPRIAREARTAASVLARLSAHPFGTVAWQRFHTQFFERYGIGALVPVLDVVDADVGLGFPAGYAGAEPQPPEPVSARDEMLLTLAQTAALDGRDELVLDDRLIDRLAAGELGRAQLPPHLELSFGLRAPSLAALRHGGYDLIVEDVSRGAGTMTGRFVGLLNPAERRRVAQVFAGLPAADPDTVAVQLSFTPLAPGTAHVARAPALLPAVVSLGEHRSGGDTIGLDDLAVGCDGQRLYLASRRLGRRVEPTVLHALDPRAHTPPLARFLAEVGRGQTVAVTPFDWGPAGRLPFLPRVRYGRTVLSPARWLLTPADVPDRSVGWPRWCAGVTAWRTRRRVPDAVYLTDGDRRLRLDCTHAGHLAVLRAQLDAGRDAVLTEAPPAGACGWFGDRPHQIVVPLVAADPRRWPALPPVSGSRVIDRDHGHLPGASPWLYAKLYAHPDRHAEILAAHLPGLLAQWAQPPDWWFIRYRDPHWHLRLRIALPDPTAFGPAACRVSTWAAALRRMGLLREVQFATSYPETGRWGGGPAMAAAEKVFGADSRALLAQFAAPVRPHPQVLAAAHMVAIAVGFTGTSQAGMRWLIEHAKTSASPAPARHVLTDAVRLADPDRDWAALRAAPGGAVIAAMDQPRRAALTDYRTQLSTVEGLDPHAVLVSLLHAHHIRAVGIDRDDERTCLRLARAAALAWQARTDRNGP